MVFAVRAGLAPRVFRAVGRVGYMPMAPRVLVCAIPRTIHTSRPWLSELRNEKNQPQKPVSESSAPAKKPTVCERVANAWSNIKYLFRFYLSGVKQIWRNRERVNNINAELKATGRALTWEETQLFRTHSSDMRKLPLFLLLLLTVEELLPLMVIYTPFMLPSTCILPSQRLSIMKRFEVKRKAAVVELRRHVDENRDLDVPVMERTDTPDMDAGALSGIEPARVRELAM